MSLKTRIQTDLKTAMRDRDALRLSTLRLINAAVKDSEIALRSLEEGEQRALSDAEVLAILTKMVKQRTDSARAYEEGGRLELAEKENAEIEIIEAYLPARMSGDEQTRAIETVIAETGASGLRDMGRVMAALKARHAGQMDFGAASPIVRARLTAT